MVRNFVRRRVILFFVAAALVVCAALGLTMLSAGGVAAHAAESHSTSHPGWTAVPTAGGELTGGNYYLTGDTPLETDLTVTGTVKLCLNGHVLTGTGTSSVITVDGGALTLCDCSTGATNTVAGVEYAGGVLTGGLSGVDGTVITLYALQVRDVAGEIDGVIAELDEAVEQVLGTDYTDASALADALGALSDKIAAAEELIGSLDTGADGLGAEIDALQAALETAQTTLGGEIDAVQQSLEDAVTRLEGLIGDGATDVTALEAALEEVKTAYAAADALLQADIDALEEQNTALSENITALQTTLEAADDAIRDAIEQLQTDLDETNGKVDVLQADLDANAQTLNTVIIVFAVLLGVVAVVSVVGLVMALRKGKK